jgi:hypothetical protein
MSSILFRCFQLSPTGVSGGIDRSSPERAESGCGVVGGWEERSQVKAEMAEGRGVVAPTRQILRHGWRRPVRENELNRHNRINPERENASLDTAR